MQATPPPSSVEAFRTRLAGLADLPKRLSQCADYVAANLDRIAVSTVAELAAGAGVPPSALMRFCQIMGFSGFSDMQRMFRDTMVAELPDYATRLRQLTGDGAGSPAALVAEFVESGRKSLEKLANNLDDVSLARAVSILGGANTLHLIGMRRAYPIAVYLAYVCEKLAIPAILHDATGGNIAVQSLRCGDVLLAISFAPYSAETLAMAVAAQQRQVAVVALTDVLTGPLAQIADCAVTVKEVDFGAFRALSASLALALGLIVAVAAARDGPTLQSAPEME